MRRLPVVFALCALSLSACAHGQGNLSDITIFDRTEGRTLPVHYRDGLRYVVGRPGNEYQISIHNRTGEDILAVVSVDGVNAITGDTAHRNQSGYVLYPRQSMAIKGWRKSLDRTAAFYFTRLLDSYAARTGRFGNVGVIGVALFRRKIEISPMIAPPFGGAAEPSREAESARAEAKAAPEANLSAPREKRLGTGHGRSEISHATSVDFERATEYPAETVTIYYDSHPNLVARGIIPPREPPHLAIPFPGQFVPDP